MSASDAAVTTWRESQQPCFMALLQGPRIHVLCTAQTFRVTLAHRDAVISVLSDAVSQGLDWRVAWVDRPVLAFIAKVILNTLVAVIT